MYRLPGPWRQQHTFPHSLSERSLAWKLGWPSFCRLCLQCLASASFHPSSRCGLKEGHARVEWRERTVFKPSGSPKLCYEKTLLVFLSSMKLHVRCGLERKLLPLFLTIYLLSRHGLGRMMIPWGITEFGAKKIITSYLPNLEHITKLF